MKLPLNMGKLIFNAMEQIFVHIFHLLVGQVN
jgi:hypothetical protein